MADSSEPDGLENRDSEFDKNASSTLSDTELSTAAGSHDSSTSIAASASKRFKMDKDDDGAPSSSDTSPVHNKREQHKVGGTEGRDSIVSFDSSAESAPRKSPGRPTSATSTPLTPSLGQDLSMVDMKTSWDGSAASGGSTKGETTDGETGYKIPFKHRAGMLADPVKIAKEREKEERVRQARERLKDERKRKLEELKEQQRIAQENREKQLEMRRKKIEDLRKRDFERRIAVEERRKMKEDTERARRESILQRAEERVARFEAWKAGGRKGMHDGGDSPARKLSVSTSVLYAKRSQEYSSWGALHPPSRPESAMGLETIREGRRSFIGPTTSTPAVSMTTQHSQRPQNVPGMTTSLTRASLTASMPSPIKLRENKPPRKQRPASVASSMPSFVGGEPAKTPRSKSTDRTGRDRSKTRPPRKDEKALKDKENLTEKAQKLDDTEENENEKDGDKDGAREHSHKKEKRERVSLSFFDRLSTPKFSKKDPEPTPKETPPKKDGPIIRVQFADDGDQDGAVEPERSFVREKPSPTHTSEPAPKHVASKDVHRAAASGSAGRSVSPGRKEVEKPAVGMPSPGHKGGDRPSSTAPRITPPPSATSTPTHGPSVQTPTLAHSAVSATSTPSHPLVTSLADDGTPTSRSGGGSAQDITAEEYKARLAEKRRQARDKAEKEAEEERRRQEVARLAEEEIQRKEEEEERKLEEEALNFAVKARRAENERLERAIEAEEKRKREEAEKLEQEKKIKGEADKKAKEEAGRLEKEKQEKAKKEDEERIQRKKKLEMIMKRVKVDTTPETLLKAESPTKSLSTSPSISQMNSSQNSPEEHEKPVAGSESSDEEGPAVVEGSAVETYSASMTSSFMQDLEEANVTTPTSVTTHTASSGDILDRQPPFDETRIHGNQGSLLSSSSTPSKPEERILSSDPSTETKSKFRSPLLQHLVENQGSSSPSSGPKFKSPLLQNLLGKTKVGARIGMSSSTGDLYSRDSALSVNQASNEIDPSMTVSASSANIGGTSKEIFKQGRDDEDKDEDTSANESSHFGQVPESFEHYSVTNGVGKDPGDAHFPTSASKSSLDSPLDVTKLPISMMSDSALGSSIEPHGEGMMSQSIVSNGHGDHKSHTMEDSSISLYSIEEGVTSSASVVETLPDPETHEEALPFKADDHLEEYIDLIDTNGKGNSLVTSMPIIAFEENNRRSDVTDYLS